MREIHRLFDPATLGQLVFLIIAVRNKWQLDGSNTAIPNLAIANGIVGLEER